MSRTEKPELVADKLERQKQEEKWRDDLEWISDMLIDGEQDKLALAIAGHILRRGLKKLLKEIDEARAGK